MKRVLRQVIIVILAAVIVFVGGSWIFAQRLTRARQCEIGGPPMGFPFTIDSVSFPTRDGQTLAGWLAPAPDRDRAIVLLHGFTGNRKQMVPRVRFFREQGYTTLLYDARAAGESTGDAITFGYREREDVIAAVKFLKNRGYQRIACLGVSQGGATILFAAEDLADVRCVICESVYDEMLHALDHRMRRYTLLPGWLGGLAMVPFAEHRLDLSINDIRPVDYVAKLRRPLFVISGDRDDRTSPADTQRLYGAARQPKELWMIEGAGHEDLFRHEGYQDRVRGFLERHFE